MNQALSGAALAAVIAVLWLLGRPRTTILRSTDTSAIAALNRSQMTLVQGSGGGPAATAAAAHAAADTPALPAASDLRGRRQLLLHLERQFQAGGSERQRAMATCAAWGHRAALPLIQRGLRDGDPRVTQLAAAAMERFRGRSAAAPGTPAQPAAKAPRNVSRTR
jgi:hypothetical protein